MMQHLAREVSGLSLARRKNATCFLRWIRSAMPDAVIQAWYQKATKIRVLESRIWSIILNMYQNAGIEKDDDSQQSLENHSKFDEIQRFSKKKIDSSHDVHRALIEAEEYSHPCRWGEYQYVSGVMGISNNPFLSTEAGAAYMNFEATELLGFWKENIFEIDTPKREKPSLGLLLENEPETISVQRSEKKSRNEARWLRQRVFHTPGAGLEAANTFLVPTSSSEFE